MKLFGVHGRHGKDALSRVEGEYVVGREHVTQHDLTMVANVVSGTHIIQQRVAHLHVQVHNDTCIFVLAMDISTYCYN